MYNYYTSKTNFFGSQNPQELIEKYGSPLYVYNETILRNRCREMTSLVSYDNFKVNYSTKANGNLELLKIIRDEGLNADAMSPGEMYILDMAGYTADELFYVSNNVSLEEMAFAVERGIDISVDSLSQLEKFGQNFPGQRVAVRFNTGIGAGHHEKVVTGGKKTKFAINTGLIPQVKEIVAKYDLKLIGINQHIGSLFMDGLKYIEGVEFLLETAKQFDDLEFIDLGGGFGIPYRKQENQPRLELHDFGQRLSEIMEYFAEQYGKKIIFKTEPGRYVVAESGVLLGTCNALKQNYGTDYIGTDLGFNTLVRPVMYDSHHDIEIFRNGQLIEATNDNLKEVNVVGNICETGDIMAKHRHLPEACEGDIICVCDAGAYGYTMASNYNNRLRPAEVLICADGSDRLIRKRDTLESLSANFI